VRSRTGRRGACLLALAALAVAVAPGRAEPARDDTGWLQAALDAGGRVYLPKLPNGECYRTRGLWVNVSRTRIASNGACIEYLGPGPARLASADGDPIAANAVFVVNRAAGTAGPPEHVAISDLTLLVPIGTEGYGVVVAGRDVQLVDLAVDGVPIDGITVTGRNNGVGFAGPVTIRDSRIKAAKRNGISVVGAVEVTIDSNSITGAGLIGATNTEPGPWAGIDVEPDTASYPIRRVTISRNTISGNGGSGVLLALVTHGGPPGVADQIDLTGNTITRNGSATGAFLRGGVCLQGGQSDGRGRLSLVGNEIVSNGGWGLCSDGSGFRMQITLACNAIHGNSYGESRWGAIDSSTSAPAPGAARSASGCG